MKLTRRTVEDFLAALRSSEPTPGGGSASALAGAAGASLLAMVAGLPKPRAATEPESRRLADAGARCTELAQQLTGLVDRDSEAYDLVIGAYRMPKGTAEEKAVRSTRIQEVLRLAIETPLEMMRACRGALDEGAPVAQLGNRNASSDVLVALELLTAGLRGASLNVEINLGSVKDQEYVDAVRGQSERLLADAGAAAEAARRGLG